MLLNRHVLRHVDEAARQVAGVGRLEGRVGQALAGTVRRDEVLGDREALLEVGLDRVLDDRARRARGRLLGLGHEATHAAELTDLLTGATSARVGHHVDGVEALLVVLEGRVEHVRDLVVRRGPDVDHLVVPLRLGDEAHLVVRADVINARVGVLDQLLLGVRHHDVGEREAQAAEHRLPEAEVLDLVEEGRRAGEVGRLEDARDDAAEVLLGQDLVDVADASGHDVVEERTADGGVDKLARLMLAVERRLREAELDPGVQRDHVLVEGLPDLAGGRERHALALLAGPVLRHVVHAQDHVLRRHRDRPTVRRRHDVVRREHEDARLQHRRVRQRHVDGHLVAVEVGVEGRRHERVQADRLALDKDRLERLDAEPVQRRRTVQHHRVAVDDLLQDVEHVGRPPVDHLLGGLDRLDDAALDELADDERLEQLDRHLLGQAALVELELRADHDDRTARVVDALAEQVLAEPALLALEHVAQGLQRAVRITADGVGLARVVEQRVDGLLEHPLLVAQDDLRGLDVDQPLEAVVPDDDAAVQVVEVRRREPAALERDERAELRRDHRDHLHHHPLRLVLHPGVGRAEGLHDAETLEGLGLAGLRGLRAGLEAELGGEHVRVHPLEQFLDGLAADHGHELLRVVVGETVVVLADLVEHVEVLVLRQERALLDAKVDRTARVHDDVRLVVDHPVEVLGPHPEERADLVRQALEVPDVDDRHGQRDVPEPLTTHRLLGHLDATAVADDALVTDALVLAAVALPVLDRAEDLLAEEAVLLRLEAPVVDRLRLEHLAERPLEDRLGRAQADGDRAVVLLLGRLGRLEAECHIYRLG